MAERMVQVPVSLIERVDSAYNASADTLAALIEQLWMLSQPIPSIADMVPGTTFSAAGSDRVDRRWAVRADGRFVSDMGVVHKLWIDPSTIRDVQPPKEQP